MKQTLACACLIVLAGIVVGLALDIGAPTAHPGPSSIAGPPAQVDLMTLWSAFRDHPPATEAHYSGRLVELTGPVLSVDKQDAEAWLWLFDLDLVNRHEARARCHFASAEFPTLARLPKSIPATIRGIVSWEPTAPLGATLVLKECRLVCAGK